MMKGSSPLTRGKLEASNVQKAHVWLIPAHAGKTRRGWMGWGCLGAHPRSRGENAHDVEEAVFGGGSSPLTRGKHTRRQVARDDHRLIPAHAGKTTPARPRRGHGRAHPRSRGENIIARGGRAWRSGSSPLTRGKLGITPPLENRPRLIPAHAGKTSTFGRF